MRAENADAFIIWMCCKTSALRGRFRIGGESSSSSGSDIDKQQTQRQRKLSSDGSVMYED